jgi:hypothetical protein
MIAGQRMRLRRSSRLAREWNIPPEAEGTLICHYRTLARGFATPDRLDVRFSPRLVVWGAPAVEFETIGDVLPLNESVNAQRTLAAKHGS